MLNKLVKRVTHNFSHTLLGAIFFTALLSLLVNPLMENINFKSFDRVFGNATLSGIDAAARTSNFIKLYVFLIPLFLILFLCILTLFIEHADKKVLKEAFDFLNEIFLLGLGIVIVLIFDKYSGVTKYENYGIQITVILITATIIYIYRPFMEFERFRSGIYLGLGMTIFAVFMLQSSKTGTSLNPLYIGLLFSINLVVVSVCLSHLNKLDVNLLKFSSIPFQYGLLLAGLCLEFFNILNQHNIFIVNRMGWAKFIYSMMLLLSIALFMRANKGKVSSLSKKYNWEMVSLIGILLSLSYFSVLPPLQIVAGPELFEQANSGMLVNDFLGFGKFPMINSFDAHTLSISMGMILYGILNNDLLGASYFGYQFVWMIPTIICTYIVFKKAFGESFAFLFMLLFPRIATLQMNFGIISAVALLYAIDKKTFKSYLWLLFSILAAFVYHIPTGFSYGGAAFIIILVSLIYSAIKERKITVDITRFAKAFIVFVFSVATLYVMICLQQKVDPIKRALEFLSVAQSTNNWAYSTVGDNTTITFSLLYSVLPMVVMICLVWLGVFFKENPSHVTAVFLLLVYLMDINRFLGRHSLIENLVGYVISTSILGISFSAAILWFKHKQSAFIITGIIVSSIFNAVAIPSATALATSNYLSWHVQQLFRLASATTLADSALVTVNNYKNYYDGSTSKAIRVDLSVPYDTHKDVIGMLNNIIPKGETFFDLSGQAMLYALTGREKPVYLNQSVVELSGEYSQIRMIEQVESYKGTCDFALLSTGFISSNLDGLSSFYRYYYIYEYLYENYTPLCSSKDGYALWVRNDRYKEASFKEKNEEYVKIPLNINESNMINDLSISTTDPLVLQCGDIDPFISVPLDAPVNIASNGGLIYEVKLKYKSTKRGSFRILFDFSGFNEEDSLLKELEATQEYKDVYFTIPVSDGKPMLNAIRLSPPHGSTFEIKSISIASVKSSMPPDVTMIDYDYLGLEHSMDIGQIPYVWGQFDKKKAWENDVVRGYANSTGEISDENQKNAKYALIKITTNEAQKANLTFKNLNGDSVSNFNFDVLEGTHKYIIRISTDWWWNREVIKSFEVLSGEGVNVEEVQFLVGD